MKRFIISIALLAGIVPVSIFNNISITRSTEEIIEKIEEIRKVADEENYDEAVILSKELDEQWKKFLGNHLYVIDSGNIMEITSLIARIDSMIKQQNKDVVTECDVVLSLLILYKHKNQGLVKDLL